MSGERVDITTQDGVADAYLARLDEGPHPAVLLIMDAYGVRPQIEAMADRIAAEGYVVLAPNLFYRDERGELLTAEEIAGGSAFEKVMPLVRGLTPEVIERDGPAYWTGRSTTPASATAPSCTRAQRTATRWPTPRPTTRPRPSVTTARCSRCWVAPSRPDRARRSSARAAGSRA